MNVDWRWVVASVFIAAIFVFLGVIYAHGNTVTVYDGDTITVADEHGGERVRLWGVDAPELDQPFGIEARDWLVTQIPKGKMRIIRKDTDRYGRTIAIIYINNRSINKAIVEEGLAWAYREYSTTYVSYEKEALKAERGLWWKGSYPVAPWNWRSGIR